ncbi:serine--tRNA ligase [bacterium]|nr:serine--tRNA ligase [bacterium]
MLDPKIIRDQSDWVRQQLTHRHYPVQYLDAYLNADVVWRDRLQDVDALKNERNRLTPKSKPTPEQQASLKQLSDTIKSKQDELSVLEESVKKAALLLPNIPHESVPIGESEDDNIEIKRVGDPRIFSFEPAPHEAIAVSRQLIDFDSAAKIAGSRFSVYKGSGAKLERALINLMLDIHTQDHGYTEFIPPVVINSASLQGTGQLPKFEGDLFKLEGTDYWLSPTAEVQLTNLARDTIIDEDNLPIRMTAQTACFRKEAGSYGKDISGIIRQHQFNKIELVQLCHPDQSMAQLHELLGHAERVLQVLKLPYRVIQLCTGDIGFSSGITFDIEVWFPSQNTYREISSCSNFFDFQARRSMIRYRDKLSSKVNYLHTINGSGLAVGRTLAAILENYQRDDGSVDVPEALIPYMKSELL